ncbi:MFS transporter [Actinomarinicola tropica]|uniref:MFS transporter n=1 Tax=Actinomarinicola tropica TaxID=2789776 RepID=A0A5Q2RG58_9ACTN|nr:MFS transporter [Actinomarinicola tropica]QGG93782.1 MFS transporter [Actinomarinicola tropica]
MNPARSPGSDAPDEPVNAARRPTLALLGAITITGIMANTLPNAGIPDILDDFGRDDAAAGLLVAGASIPGIVVAPLIGLLADRYGRRTVLVPCLVVFGLFGALGGLAPSYETLVLARFGQGIGSAGLINLTNIIIGDHWEGVERSRMFGYNSAILTVSLTVFPFVGGVLTDLGTWRYSFVPYPLALVTAVVVLRRLGPGQPDRDADIRSQLSAAATVVRNPGVWGPVGLAFTAFVFVFGLFLTVLPVHLEAEFGMSASERGLVVAVPAVGATIGALLLGRLRSRLRARTVAAGSFGLFALAYPVVGLAGALPLLLVGAIVYGLGEGLVLPTLTDIVAGSAPERSRGAVLSVQVSAIRAGQTAGPLLAGAAMGVMATGTVFVVAGGLAALVACAAAALRLQPR